MDRHHEVAAPGTAVNGFVWDADAPAIGVVSDVDHGRTDASRPGGAAHGRQFPLRRGHRLPLEPTERYIDIGSDLLVEAATAVD